MLKWLCCFLSLLLSLCLLLPVFSVSISAISVDGYDVFTSVYDSSLGDYKEFDTTISLDVSTDYLSIIFEIHLPEVIKKNTIFDLEVDFTLGKFSPTNFNGVGTMFDSNWNQLDGVLSGIVEDGKLKESQIIAEGNVKYIRYVFDYCYPVWYLVDSSGFNGTDLSNTTWLFNNNISIPSERLFVYSDNLDNTNCQFQLDNVSCYALETSSYLSGYYSLQLFDSNNVYFCKSSGRVSSQYNYLVGKQIKFNTGFKVSDGFIPWLQENATLQQGGTLTVKYTFDFAVSSVTLTQEEGETGIFAGIFGWIKKIFNAILDIPNKIADLIKGLFIPSEEAIIELKDKFEALFADRFGAAYQSIEVVEQFGQAMGISTYSDTVDTITFPSVTVPLAGTEFTFGGWEVDLVPKGFEGLITPLKLIVDLVCTIACVNMFRRRMEGVLR